MMKILWLAVGFILSITTIGYAQDRTVTGVVTDLTNDEGLPGVNIVAKGTSTGTVTDVDGNYRLTLSDGVETLVFSSVGFTQEEQPINGQTVINVAMSPDIQSLQEIVVVGYGTQEKEDVTGALVVSRRRRSEKIPVPSFNEAIQGQVAGGQCATVQRAARRSGIYQNPGAEQREPEQPAALHFGRNDYLIWRRRPRRGRTTAGGP